MLKGLPISLVRRLLFIGCPVPAKYTFQLLACHTLAMKSTPWRNAESNLREMPATGKQVGSADVIRRLS